MFEVAIADIFLKAFILVALLYFLARHEADYEFAKVAMVTAGIMFGSMICTALLGKYLGAFVILPVIAFIAWMLMTFCWLSLVRAILVTVFFVAASAGIDYAKSALLGGMQNKVEAEGKTTRDVIDKQNAEGMQVVKELGESADRMSGLAPSGSAGTNVKMKAVTHIDYNNDEGYGGSVVTNFVEDKVDWNGSRSQLTISARMVGKDKQMMAVVSSQMVKQGGLVTVRYGLKEYTWRLKALTKTSADWEQISVKDL